MSSTDLHTISFILSTYPSFIFDVGLCSFIDKGFYCVLMAFTSCIMQGSSLREKQIFQWQYDSKLIGPFILDYSVPDLLDWKFTIFNSDDELLLILLIPQLTSLAEATNFSFKKHNWIPHPL